MDQAILEGSRWRTANWRNAHRFVTVKKVEQDEVTYSFEDNDNEPRLSVSAFRRTFVPVEEA